MVSKNFITAIKLNEKPAYRIAQAAGINPSTLSKLMCGIAPVRDNDLRILAVARVLGLSPENCFDASTTIEGDGSHEK